MARLAMAALVAEAGRVRVAGPERRDRLVALPDSAEVTVPATTAAVGTATGGINIQNAERVVVVWEATWLERTNLLGPLLEWAVVVGPSKNPEALHLPLVRLVTDRKGRALDSPKEIDLGRATQARTFPRIVNVIEPDRARFNVTKPFLTGAGSRP